MKDYSHNWTNKRYKNCGFGKPYYDENGHYEDVLCKLKKDFCGDFPCPLDEQEDNER